jgi:hypothetical protein
MNWTDEPATWKQLKFLKQCGYQLERRLTKIEAAVLISRYNGHPEGLPVQNEGQETIQAQHLRRAVDAARRELAERGKGQTDLEQAVAERQEFWLDTCRGAAHLKSGCMQVLELYRTHGCLFTEPTRKQVQDILDALDAAMPLWDQEHPELFYQALKLNFPELCKQAGLRA